MIDAMPDGTGVARSLDGKMLDDATWKQAKVICRSAGQAGRRSPRERARDEWKASSTKREIKG
jgi:malyl-CoA/(S)-citramalyl-CoA lyase